MAAPSLTSTEVMNTDLGVALGDVGSYIADAALEAAGAYNDPDFVPLAKGVRRVAFWITYTMNAPATSGGAKFRVEWRDADEQSAVEPVNNGAALVEAQPYAQMRHYLGEFMGPIAQSVTPIRWPVVFEVPPGAKAVRLLAAEVVDTTNKGNLQVDIAAGGGL